MGETGKVRNRAPYFWAAGGLGPWSLPFKVLNAVAQPLKGVKRECQNWRGASRHQQNPPPKNSSFSGLPVSNDGSANLPVAFYLSPVPSTPHRHSGITLPFPHLRTFCLALCSALVRPPSLGACIAATAKIPPPPPHQVRSAFVCEQ